MNIVSLGEIVEIKGGGTPDKSVEQYWNGSIPWASVKDFKSVELSETSDYITELGLKNSASNLIPAGTIIVPTRMAVGKAAINTIDLAINQDLKALFPKQNVFNKYLLHVLLANSNKLERQASGATVKGITLEVLRTLEIPLPPLAEQKRIAAILDQADALRKARRRAIERLNDLSQSIFYEMFGDPIEKINQTGGVPLGKHTAKIGSGATPKGGEASYKNSGVTLIRSMNVRDGYFTTEGLAFIDDIQAAALNNVVVEKDDVLINITGASVARVCMAPAGLLPARVNQHVSILRTDGSIRPRFLEQQLLFPSFKKNLLRIAEAGATRQAITKEELEKLLVIAPNIALQVEFEHRVQEVQKVFINNNLHLEELERLFVALQQRAFRGELSGVREMAQL